MERFAGLRLSGELQQPRALGDEYRLHHSDPTADGLYRTSRIVRYDDGQVEEFATRISA
jgi:hypothetical protein